MPNEEPDNPPTPDDVPTSSGTEEIEKLLAQAESLVNDIAGTVGVEPAGRGSEGLPTPMPEEPDALTVVEMATHQVEELERAVDAEASSKTVEVVEAPRQEPSIPDAVQAFESAAPAEPVGEAVKPVIRSTESSGRGIGARAGAVDVKGEQEGAAATAVVEAPPVRGQGERKESEAADATQAVEADAEIREPSTAGDKKRLARRVAMSVYMALRNVAVAVPNSMLRVLMVLNKPLAGLSSGTRMIIGLIGLISLVMGGLAFVLPKLMHHNPYADMKPYAE